MSLRFFFHSSLSSSYKKYIGFVRKIWPIKKRCTLAVNNEATALSAYFKQNICSDLNFTDKTGFSMFIFLTTLLFGKCCIYRLIRKYGMFQTSQSHAF